jgi:hypothetical protein
VKSSDCQLNRRGFLGAATLPVLAAAAAGAAPAARPKPPFRVLYSNDTTNTLTCVSPWHKRGAPFRRELLEATVDEVAGRGVEVHLLQPGLGWIPWWKSKVYPADAHYRWFTEQTGLAPDSFGQYMLDGGDMVQVFLDRCRRRGQTPFISLRMNDGHHLENAGLRNRGAACASRFYVEHPEYRIGPNPDRWEQRVLNWAIPAVREHKLAFIRELCENYDFAGFELDFMRFYNYFQTDKTTLDERRQIMTGFVRQVREVLDRTSTAGRRRWLCARVPCYQLALDGLGLAPAMLVDAGVDMLNVSASYFTIQQTDLAAIRRQAPGAAVYLEFCHTIANGRRPAVKGYDTFPFRRATPEQIATAAHLAYRRGADGISAFNVVYYREHGGPGRGPFNEPPFSVFEHLGDPAWLARRPQHYILTPGWGNAFVKRPVMPRSLKPGQTTAFQLDLAPPEGGWKRGGRFRIQAETAMGDSRWTARLNGEKLEPNADRSEPYPNPYPPMLGKPDQMRAWSVPANLLRDGLNRIELALHDGDPAKLDYLDLGLQ